MAPRPSGQLYPFVAIPVFMDCHTVAYSWTKSTQFLFRCSLALALALPALSPGSIDLISHLARAAIHPPSCNEVVLRHQLRFGRWKKMQQLAKAPQQMFGRRTSATPWENKLSPLHLHSIA